MTKSIDGSTIDYAGLERLIEWYLAQDVNAFRRLPVEIARLPAATSAAA